jgi:hypothetical protein
MFEERDGRGNSFLSFYPGMIANTCYNMVAARISTTPLQTAAFPFMQK